MTIRRPAGQLQDRPRRSRHLPVLVVIVVALSLGLGAGWLPVMPAKGNEVPTEEPVPDEPISTETPIPTEPAPTVEPIPPEPAPTEEPIPTELAPTEAPPTESVPTEAPTPAEEPTSTEPAPTEESPRTEAVPTEPVPTEEPRHAEPAIRSQSDGGFASAAVESCASVSGPSPVAQGGDVVYTCDYEIVVPVTTFTEIDLAWTIAVVETSAAWTVALDDRGDATENWTLSPLNGDEPDLDGGADEDTEPATFTYTVQFGIRLTAPDCGGPITPVVAVTSSAAATIDGGNVVTVPEEVDNQVVSPTLDIAAPSPVLTRAGAGDLDDSNDPLRYSHAPQVVNAGTLNLDVTSAYCGGWNVSISATDFVPAGEGVTFAATNLVVTSMTPGAGAPVPLAAPLTLGTGDQALVSAPSTAIAADTYSYALSLELTIPGGTPPGTYTSTVTVTTSAAP